MASSGLREMPVLCSAYHGALPTLIWPLFMPTPQHLIVSPYCQSTGPLSTLPGTVGSPTFNRKRYIAHLAALEGLSANLPPSLRYIEAHLPIDFLDWLPCATPAGMWRSSVAYTHLLDLTDDPRRLYNNLITRKLRRASALALQPLWSDETNTSNCLKMLTDLCHLSLQRSHGDRICASSLHRLIVTAMEHHQGTVHLLLSPISGIPVAGAFVAYHAGTAYYIAGGQSRDKEGQDAMTLLLDNLFNWSRERGCNAFDFEGSMHAGIAFFFRNFGAVPHPYLRLRAGRQTLGMRLRLRHYYLQHLY